MAYTQKQWDAQQASFPVEDRMSYAEYLQFLKVEDPAGYLQATTVISGLQRGAAEPAKTAIVDERSKIINARANELAQQAAIVASGNVLANYKATEAATLIVDEQTKSAAMRAAGDSAAKVPSIYSKGMRIDAAGNYVGYNPEMEGMTSASGSPTVVPTPAQSAAKNVMPSDADVEADYQAYLLEKKAAAEATAQAEADAKAAQEAADKAAADAKAAQEAADKAAADAAAATAADKAAADAKAAELAAEAAAKAELAAATAAAADAAAANADATAGLPNGTPTPDTNVIPDPTGAQAPEFYNKLKGKASSGTPLTAEENSFVGNFLKHRAGILGGLQFQGKQLTPEQLAERNFLVGLGYIKAETPTVPPETPTVTNDYEDVGGILTYKGEAYTGAYNGKNYVNGRVVETPGDDIYETVNGVFKLNGKPYTGIYGDKEYKDGVEVPVGSGNYETIGGIFTYKGTAYTGEYQGKKYVNGLEQKTAVEDKYETVNGVFTKNGAAFTGEYDGKQYVDGKIKTVASDYVSGPDGMLLFKGDPFTGEYQGKNYVGGIVKEPTDLDATPDRPADVNKFYVYDKTTKTWVQPPKPQDGATYSWDDNTGWIQETPGADKPAGTPAAYIYDEKTKTWIKPPQTDPNTTWDDTKGWVAKVAVGKKIVSTTYTGSGATRKRVVTYDDNTTETFDDPDTAGAGTETGTGTSTGVFTQKDIDDAVAAALKTSTETTAQKNMIQILTDRFAQYGLAGLATKIKELAVSGATEATITLGLQATDEYKMRFSANADRIKKGLAVLSPAEYLNVEDSYRQVLRAYGLKQFDTDDYVKQFISNDISPTELSNRVVTAVQRVQNADPAIINQLKQYYGIGATDMVGYVLDPEQSYQKIQRQIAASEIGVAAGRQGLETGVSVAEQLAAQGVTEAEAQKGYATIADILPTAEKLSSIYGTTLEGYGQSEGEQEVFNSLASAQRKRQKLTAREIAAFSGSSGAAKTSLSTSRVGQF